MSALMFFLLACGDATIAIDGEETAATDPKTDETDSGSTTEPTEDFSMWDEATLVVLSPESGAFLPYGEENDFSAEIRAADGSTLDFPDIQWSSDIDSSWFPVGDRFADDEIEVGEHAITATAELPNGDRLAYTVGGVLVQDAYAGIYSGTLSVDVSGDYDGTTYEVGCSGALKMTIDAYGEVASGDASCLLSLFGFDLDSAYTFDLENDAGTLSGDAEVDLVITSYSIEAAGSVTEDGVLEGAFSTEVYGVLTLDGTFSATRLTRDLTE